MAVGTHNPGRIRVREVRETDLPDCVLLAERCFAEIQSSEGAPPADHVSTVGYVRSLWENPDAYCVLAEHNGQLVGGGIYQRVPFPMSLQRSQVVEVFWHSDPQLSRSLRARVQVAVFRVLDKWAGSTAADSILFSLPVDSSAKAFLQRKGFVATETVYRKAI